MEDEGTLRCREPASEELLDRLRRGNAGGKHKRQIVFAESGTEERRYLRAMSANANVGGPSLTHLILLPDARKVEVLEEFLHGTQFRMNFVQREGILKAEIHVKRFMIRHSRLLGISAEDVQIIGLMLKGIL
jgi:hypothetical protein